MVMRDFRNLKGPSVRSPPTDYESHYSLLFNKNGDGNEIH